MDFATFLTYTRGKEPTFERALIEVCDTAEGVLIWFKEKGLKPTASDVVAMTDLVLKREWSYAIRPLGNEDDE